MSVVREFISIAMKKKRRSEPSQIFHFNSSKERQRMRVQIFNFNSGESKTVQ